MARTGRSLFLVALAVTAPRCAPLPDPHIQPGQCPPGTFGDNSAAGKASVTVSGNVEVLAQTGGAAVSTSGEGSARFTCRQMCPAGTAPSVEEQSSPAAGTTYRYHCAAAPGKPGSDYVEVHRPDGTATGTILSPAPTPPDAGS